MGILRRLWFSLSYYRNPPWDTGISPPELIDFIASHPPGSALDIGCGSGTNVITLTRSGWRVAGIDFAPRAIQLARKKAKQAGISADLRVADISQLDSAGGPFDLILDIGCLHGLSREARSVYLDKAADWLAPGGTFLLYAFLSDQTQTAVGIDQLDQDQIKQRFTVISQQTGTDRGQRTSVWLKLTHRT
jgi:cyclopropane fatty-acyl-phospholipid synthase-like methyltransferase